MSQTAGHTLYLGQRYTDDGRLLAEEARKRGYSVYRMRNHDLSEATREGAPLVYAEGFTAEYFSQELDIVLLRPLLNSLSRAPQRYLKRRMEYLRKSDLRDEMFPAFVKPVDQKFFQAGVYTSIQDVTGLATCPDSEELFLSERVSMKDEFRFFCLDGVVKTGSAYFRDQEFVGESVGELEPKHPAWAFTADLLQNIPDLVPRAVVVDVAMLTQGELCLVEFNPVWASGIYGCDPGQVLDCIAGACCWRENLRPEDRVFEVFRSN